MSWSHHSVVMRAAILSRNTFASTINKTIPSRNMATLSRNRVTFRIFRSLFSWSVPPLLLLLLLWVPPTRQQEEDDAVYVTILARPGGGDKIIVEWTVDSSVSDNVTSYDLSWSTGGEGDGDESVSIDDGSTDTYTITGLSPCTIYTITLQPCDDTGPLGQPGQTSANTNTQGVTPVSSVVVAAVPTNSHKLEVSWDLVIDIGKCPGYYKVTWNVSEVFIENTTSYTSYTITGLDTWTLYTVCVDSGQNKSSLFNRPQYGNAKTSEEVPGGPPLNVSVTSTTSDAIELQWQPPATPNGDIVSYTVTWRPEDGEGSYTTPGDSYTYTIPGLLACTSYTISVTAATSKGDGPPGNTSGSTPAEVSGPPTNVTAALVVDHSHNLSVTWTQANVSGRCNITSNTVTWQLADSEDLLGEDTVAATETYSIGGLAPWTTYQVCVSAINHGGESPTGCNNETTDEDIPGPPADVATEAVNSSSILVSWLPPNEPNGIITGYLIQWRSELDAGDSEVVENTTTSYAATNLIECTVYSFTVNAATKKGNGTKDASSNTTATEPPPSPEPVTCTNIEARNITISWAEPDTKCNVTQYLVDFYGAVLWSNSTDEGSDAATINSNELDGLIPWTNYTVCVRAETVGDLEGDSSCCEATTLQAAPGLPADLRQSGSDSNSVSVTWLPPEEVNGQLSGYRLSWQLGSRNLSHRNLSYLDLSAKITGLDADTTYTIHLQGITDEQYVGEAKEIEASTKPKPSHVGAIVGGVVGLLLLILLVLAVVFRGRIKAVLVKKNKSSSTAPGFSLAGSTSGLAGSTSGLAGSTSGFAGSTSGLPRPPVPPKPKPVLLQMTQPNWEKGIVGKYEIRRYIQHLEEDTQRGLEEEFQKLKNLSPTHSTLAALRDYNKPKNRWINILPYDHSRVKLTVMPSQPGSDYINANYILDDSGQYYFVATQGPKENTVPDFWRMVWELRIYTIVMLTNIREKGKNKCEQYWPNRFDPPHTYDSFAVTNQSEDFSAEDYTVRLIVISKGEQKRVVKQFHFTTWPDFDAPSHEDQLLGLVKAVRETKQEAARHILVHCSAGVGRTGTFIGLWNLTEAIQKDPAAPTVNVREAVLRMRECRPAMVQSQEQLLYLWKCVAAYLEHPARWAPAGRYNDDHVYDNAAFSEPTYDNL